MNIRILLVISSFLTVFSALSQPPGARTKCAEAITDHIKKHMLNDGTYKSYNFSNLEVHKPRQYYELEELIRLKKVIPDMDQHYSRKEKDSIIAANDTAIQRKKREIMNKRLHISYQMLHTFIIRNKKGVNTAYRFDFFLNHTYKVKNVKLIFSVELSNDQAKQFYYFQKRLPIFDIDDPYDNEQASTEIYDFFEEALFNSEYDDQVMYSALRVIKNIRDNGYLNLDKLGGTAISDWVENNKPDLNGYRSMDHSYMLEIKKEIDGSDQLVGYKMFHKYSYKNDSGDRVEDVVYFEFDSYFVIRGTMRVSPPYDQYFVKEE